MGAMDDYIKDVPMPPLIGEEAPTTDLVPERSEAELVELLGTLAGAAGSSSRAVKLLAERGVVITRGELDVLRERHTPLYAALAEERARAVEEGIAQSYRELVVGTQRVTKKFIDDLADDLEKGKAPRDTERTIQALAKVMQVSTDKLLSITGRPVAGQQRDPMEALRELEKLGVAKVNHIEATAEEVVDE